MFFFKSCSSLFILIMAFAINTAHSQSDTTSNSKQKSQQKATEYFDEQAMPPGGMTGYYQYLAKHIKYPEAAIKAKAKGRILIRIYIDSVGNVIDAKIYDDPVGFGCGEEAVRVIKSMPPWKPGKINGKAISTTFPVYVKFKLSD